MEEDMKKMLAENAAAIAEVREMNQKILKYIRWVRVMDAIKLSLILIPILAAAFYLPSFIEMVKDTYTQFLTSGL